MAHLTDSPFEAVIVKICQDCYRCLETVPLNDCEGVERVLVIIGTSRYQANGWEVREAQVSSLLPFFIKWIVNALTR